MNTFIEDYYLSNEINKNNFDSYSKNNSYQNSSETYTTYSNSNNYISQNIILNISQNKKKGGSFPLNFLDAKNNFEHSQLKNSTQNIILYSLNTFNNLTILNYENKKDKLTQHIILKSLKSKEEENIKKINNDKNENNNNYTNTNIILNSNSIIKLISSNDKISKNFPVEYLNEIISDLCYNLYHSKINLERIKFNQQGKFFQMRMSLFNFILHLGMNSPISEGTIFLTYNIFDKYISVQSTDNDELILIIISSFCLATKYIESCIPNLDELCCVCNNKYTKEQMIKCELNIMEKLDYNISRPTIFDLFQFIKIIKNMTPKEYNLGLFIFEMFIISGQALKYNSLIIIEAVYLLILETTGKERIYLNLYNYFVNRDIDKNKYNEDINNCLLDIKNECLHVKDKNFEYLIKKFESEKYQKISVDFQLL